MRSGFSGTVNFSLFADVAKEAERVGVVLFEVAEPRPKSSAREGDVRLEAADTEVRVEREIGHARCPRGIVVSEAGRLIPIPHPPDDGLDVLLSLRG